MTTDEGHDALTTEGTKRLLGAIVLLGLVLRLAYLLTATSDPGFVWQDPDNYMQDGYELARGENGWHWDFDVVRYRVGDIHYALPPLYIVFLSLFAAFPGAPLTAQIAQALLATGSIPLVFLLGKRLHSPRAGLWAATATAIWLPSIIAVWSTMQESIYVPLVLSAFVAMTQVSTPESRWRYWFLSGLLFAGAALTRSMPVYFLPPVALLAVLWSDQKRYALRQSAALLAGFALLTVPYSVALSRHLGRATFIENHASQRIASEYEAYLPSGERKPMGSVAIAETLWRAFSDRPVEFVSGITQTTKSVFHVNGGRLLQLYLSTQHRVTSQLWRVATDVSDLIFVSLTILAPFGVALARDRRVAVLLALWVLLNIFLTSLSGFGGARFRLPIEPQLVLFGSVVISGKWRHPQTRVVIFVAAVVALGLAAVTVPQLPWSFRARGDHGIGVQRAPGTGERIIFLTGEGAFNTLVDDGGAIDMRIERAGATAEETTHVDLFLDGEASGSLLLRGAEPRRSRHESLPMSLVHVELRAWDAATNEPVHLRVRLLRSE